METKALDQRAHLEGVKLNHLLKFYFKYVCFLTSILIYDQ